MFGIGTGELLMLLVIAMLVVGPERVAEFAAQFGRAVAKFRRETDSMTREFREAFTLESGEEGESAEAAETASVAASGQEANELPSSAGEAAEESPTAASATVVTASVEEQGEAEAEQAGLGAPFLDRETEVGPSAEKDVLEEETPETAEPVYDVQPVAIQVAELVPEDEDVEPTLIEEPVLVVGPEASDRPVDEVPDGEE